MSKNKPSKKPAGLRWQSELLHADFLTFNGLHGVTSQKIEVFIITGVRTSNPTVKGKVVPVLK
jgi:hypothetical protein